MNQTDRTYSILIVSSSRNFQEVIDAHFPESSFTPLHIVTSISAAKRKVSEYTYDLVVINSPLPDDVGTRFAIDTAMDSVVMLLVSSDIYEEANYKLSGQGIFVLPKPFSKVMFATAVNWMRSAREIVKKSQKKTLTIEEKMEEIRIVNRAKWLLINERQMSEPDAHRYIEKHAMDRCISKGEIAKEIIDMYK